MKPDPREMFAHNAEMDILDAISRAMDRYHLTDGELVMILSQKLASVAKSMIRQERQTTDESTGIRSRKDGWG